MPNPGPLQYVYTLLGVLGIVGSLGLTAWLTYITTRGIHFKALREESDGWQRLAKVREEEIANLSRRVTDLDLRMSGLREENTELRRLNLDLQKENVELKRQVDHLQDRVDQLTGSRAPRD